MVEFNISNTGIIEKADIKIDGLTVLCGENNTGKSTIGKLLFLFIKNNRRPIREKEILNNFGIKLDKLDLTTDSDFLDATLIEDTLLLELGEATANLSARFNFDIEKLAKKVMYYCPFDHIVKNDTIEKLIYTANKNLNENWTELDLSEQERILLIKIRSIMGGYWEYNAYKKDFVFCNYSFNNIKFRFASSGIKAFGIIEMLLTGEFLLANKLLIIDEPEAHLHPEWQIKYADILTDLVKNGVPILLSTHSPYILQALLMFNRKKGIVDKSNFYLAEKKDGKSIFIDKTQSVSDIFEVFAKPMRNVSFDKDG